MVENMGCVRCAERWPPTVSAGTAARRSPHSAHMWRSHRAGMRPGQRPGSETGDQRGRRGARGRRCVDGRGRVRRGVHVSTAGAGGAGRDRDRRIGPGRTVAGGRAAGGGAPRGSRSCGPGGDRPGLVRGGRTACTFVAGVAGPEGVWSAWVGDSRAYWLPDEGPGMAMTEDDIGRNDALTAWLGADAGPVTPQVRGYRPLVAGRLLLCTDGLWRCLPDAAGLRSALAGHAPDACTDARTLVGHALRAGGADNVTAAVIRVVPSPPGDDGRPTAAQRAAAKGGRVPTGREGAVVQCAVHRQTVGRLQEDDVDSQGVRGGPATAHRRGIAPSSTAHPESGRRRAGRSSPSTSVTVQAPSAVVTSTSVSVGWSAEWPPEGVKRASPGARGGRRPGSAATGGSASRSRRSWRTLSSSARRRAVRSEGGQQMTPHRVEEFLRLPGRRGRRDDGVVLGQDDAELTVGPVSPVPVP